jgi:RecA/RadA recombinase
MTLRKNLLAVKGFSDAKVSKILLASEKLIDSGATFVTARSIADERAGLVRISTGSKALDALLEGGVETRSVTELCGEFRTGKSQCCHTLAVTAQLPRSEGGGAGKVIWIDTEGTFRPERIKEIARRYGIEGDDVLDNIMVAHVHNSDQQVAAVKYAAATIVEDDAPVSLLIIDSIINCFRVDYTGRGELAIRQQTLNKHLNDIKKLANEFNLAVVITNQVSAKPDSTMSFGPGYSAVGGHILSHFSTTRLMLRKGRGEQRVVKVVDSPTIPERDAIVQITSVGINDVQE